MGRACAPRRDLTAERETWACAVTARDLGLRSAGPVATGPIARAQPGSEACARGRRVLAAVASAHEGVFLGWRFSFKVCVSFQVQTF